MVYVSFRHAYRSKLNVVVPKEGLYLGTDILFNRNLLEDAPWANLSFQIFTLHGRWNFIEVDQLMGSNTKYITVIRDPVDVFESFFGYSELHKFYGVNLTTFIENVKDEPNSKFYNRRRSNYIGRNQISWDFGVDPKDFDNMPAIRKKIFEIEKHFDLVMIAERMDESLVLLQDVLCWPTEHVTHLDLNQRKRENTVQLTDQQRQVLRTWLRADYAIYDYFREKFDQRVASARSSAALDFNLDEREDLDYFDEKVLQLQIANDDLARRCVIDHVDTSQLSDAFRSTAHKPRNTMGYAVNT